MCPNLEKCCVIAKALSACVQGPCETGETVDLSKQNIADYYQIAPFPAKESGLTMYDNAVLGCAPATLTAVFRVSRLPGNFKVVTPPGEGTRLSRAHPRHPLPARSPRTRSWQPLELRGGHLCSPSGARKGALLPAAFPALRRGGLGTALRAPRLRGPARLLGVRS